MRDHLGDTDASILRLTYFTCHVYKLLANIRFEHIDGKAVGLLGSIKKSDMKHVLKLPVK